MISLKTKFMGLALKNPIIIGSSGLTNSVEKIKKLAENNAGAIVLKSLFEEQILSEMGKSKNNYFHDYPEAHDYANFYTKEKNIGDYLNLIEEAKNAVDIPIIASINCINNAEWVSFAKKIENAGADAIELNVAILPSENSKKSEENEKQYFSITEAVKAQVNIPVSLKMSNYSAGLSNLIHQLSYTGKVDSFVLFNRFYMPDININSMQMTSSNALSTPAEISNSLRWIALLSGSIKKELVASTGVHDAEGAIKQILAGANSVQIVSSIYERGPQYIFTILEDIKFWMKSKGFKNINEFRGKLSYDKSLNPAIYERTQFMKYFGDK